MQDLSPAKALPLASTVSQVVPVLSHSLQVLAAVSVVLVSDPQMLIKYSSKSWQTARYILILIVPFRQFFGGGGLGGLNMNGMGGASSMFDMDVDDDMGGARSFGFNGGMPGGFGGMPRRSSPRRSSPQRSQTQPSEITRPLKVSLSELYNGATKRIKVGRRLLNGSTENKVLDIQIHPGWKSGTKIRFPRTGNDKPNGEPQDLIFVVEEKPHDGFTREVNDLIYHVSIPLLEALAGPSGVGKSAKVVEMLDGRKLQVSVPPGIIKPGQVTTIRGEGMPIRKDGSVQRKGDLIVKWDVVFPATLTSAQQEGLKKILK